MLSDTPHTNLCGNWGNGKIEKSRDFLHADDNAISCLHFKSIGLDINVIDIGRQTSPNNDDDELFCH